MFGLKEGFLKVSDWEGHRVISWAKSLKSTKGMIFMWKVGGMVFEGSRAICSSKQKGSNEFRFRLSGFSKYLRVEMSPEMMIRN